MAEDFGVPAPGETALIAASIAAAQGKLSIWLVVLAAFVGAVVGDNIGYAIGRLGGRRLVVRVGGRVGLSTERLEHAEGFFKRYGDAVVAGARFVEVLRQLNGIVAGTLGMHWATFLAYNALGAALWVGAWGAAGYFAGEHLRQVEAWLSRFSYLALIAIAAAALLAWLVHRARARTNAGAQTPSGPTG